jgi:2-alkenal reductase
MNTQLKVKFLPAVLAALLAGTTITGLAAGATVGAVAQDLTARTRAQAPSAQVLAANSPAVVNTVPVAQPAADTPAVAAPAASVADSLQAAVESVYAQANASVVYIVVSAGGNGFGGSQASGSGFVYNANGMIVTNAHVVSGADSIEVIFADGSHQSAQLVGADAAHDLAVIQVAQVPATAVPLALAADDSVSVGEFVTAIGSPFGEQNSMSFGIVSGLGRTMSNSTSTRGGRNSLGSALNSLIQTDAPINPGNSGGPLLNLDGQVVGINNAIESTSGSGAGVGFAIPTSVIRQVVPGIIASAG